MDAVSFEHVSDTDWLQTRLNKPDFGRPEKEKTPVIAMITGILVDPRGFEPLTPCKTGLNPERWWIRQ